MSDTMLLPAPEQDMPDFIKNKVQASPRPQKGRKPHDKPKRRYKVKIAMLAVIVAALFYGVYQADRWFDSHTLEFRSPIQSPVLIKARVSKADSPIVHTAQAAETAAPAVEPEVKPIGDNEVIAQAKYRTIISRVYQLESSSGRNDKCVRKGKGVNGLGYGQRINVDNCYSSFEAVVADVDKWFEKRFAEGMDIPTAICYYNLGKKLSTCDYYQNYLSLN